MSDAVRLREVTVEYGAMRALDRVDITMAFGTALGIVGPNGSGKSTLLKTIAGLIEPRSGILEVLGSRPRDLPPGSIAYVPQIEAVDWSFPVNVWDVVAMGRFPRIKPFGRFSARDREAVSNALEALRLGDLRGRHISQLSGGQQQRVFVARAIAQDPRILLLDEPTTGVDAATEESLRELVRGLVHQGLPVIMTTHDLDRAPQWFDRLIVLDHRVKADGAPDEVLESGAYAGLRPHVHVMGLPCDHEEPA